VGFRVSNFCDDIFAGEPAGSVSLPGESSTQEPVTSKEWKTLVRPDTIYLCGYYAWNPEILKQMTEARNAACLKDPSLGAAIQQLLAESDPDEEARLQSLPYHELQALGRARQGELATIRETVASSDVSVEIAGITWSVIPNSPRRHCHLSLQREGITLHVRLAEPSKTVPTLYLEIGSIPLWSQPSWREYLKGWVGYLDQLGFCEHHPLISRVDIAHHTQCIGADDLRLDYFVCRAETAREITRSKLIQQLESACAHDEYSTAHGEPSGKVRELVEQLEATTADQCAWYRGRKIQQIAFGTRGRIYARLYNKTSEVVRNRAKHEFFKELWQKNGMNPDREVINVEFEICRSWLRSRELCSKGKQITINTVDDLIEHYDALRAYLLGNDQTKGWLRMIDTNTSTRIERCVVAVGWAEIREGLDYLEAVYGAAREAVIQDNIASRSYGAFVRWAARNRVHHLSEIPPEEWTKVGLMHAIFKMIDEQTNGKWTPKATADLFHKTRARLGREQFPEPQQAFDFEG